MPFLHWFSFLVCYRIHNVQLFSYLPFNLISLIILIAHTEFNSKCPYFISFAIWKVNRKEFDRRYLVRERERESERYYISPLIFLVLSTHISMLMSMICRTWNISHPIRSVWAYVCIVWCISVYEYKHSAPVVFIVWDHIEFILTRMGQPPSTKRLKEMHTLTCTVYTI